jgi:hypothetical protein
MISCPFKIIQAAIANHPVFVQEHENEDDFNAGNFKAHQNLLIMWYMAVGQESIPKTCFFILPDDNNLKRHKSNAHYKHILPTLDAAAAASIDPAETVDVLRLLGATMARSSKAVEAQNVTQHK